ncbi:hypothetical protein [Nitrosovibrio sp. Nv4]|uniref:hypothetical protein n=1 Tax=Nitrosovibrio sp. Nv4 TaxID=1945880 RepID=UPI000BD9573F|nr:hypothetical protein [Nitrosovibrio sp. Nv4]SOD41357.1 hypothetical protein SAMN06298226_1652 [Nitrosovibrio sp. Nv4]SOD41366.1 hypothetical protein SAMN06298226_1661 [Nitrosovibrio sp. Nv4]
MADEIDQGNETAEFFLDLALRKQQQQDVSTPKGIGMCLSCETDIDDDRRWCDAACRDDYQKAQWQAKQIARCDDDEEY